MAAVPAMANPTVSPITTTTTHCRYVDLQTLL
jgi:hypothetical protein